MSKVVTVGWLDSVEHSRWLSRQMQALLENGHAKMTTTGFGYYSSFGLLDLSKPVDLAITAKMTYVYSLGTLMGIPGSRRYCDHGVKCLRKYFHDAENGGWFSAIKHEPDEGGNGVPWSDKAAEKWQFPHSALILAAAAATVANRPGAHELLRDALIDQEQHWLEEGGLVRDSFSRDWSECRPYRGMNSLMHSIEAYLAAAEATNNPEWIRRAEVMLRFVNEQAEALDWRVPGHFDESWNPDLEYNRDAPATPYYPFGYVIGHGMELARLAVQTRAAFRSLGWSEPTYLMPMATELFERARIDGWRRSGEPGFICSADFEGNPVIDQHMQWVVSEGLCAAVAVRRAILDDGASEIEIEAYEHSYRSWLDYLNDYMLVEPGVLVRMLDSHNEPLNETLPSRPDIYHSLQAMLMPRLPLWPTFASALSRNLLDKPQQPPSDRKSWRMFR